MYVYIEQLLIENLIINYIILYVTKLLIKSDTSKTRIFIASIIGSIYTLSAFFPPIITIVKLISKIIVAVTIIRIAFKPKNIRIFLKIMATFHLVAFTFAGISLSLIYMANINAHINNGVFYISNFKVKKLAIAIAFGWILFQLTFEYLKNKNINADNFVFLKIEFAKKEISLKGMIDTGNSLKDPINKLPVIIVEFLAIKDLFPIEIQELFEKHSENNLNLFTNVLYNASSDFKFRLIPFKSLGKEDGMILGFKPDKVTLELEKDTYVKELIVGIYNNNLSDDYRALLHPDIIA